MAECRESPEYSSPPKRLKLDITTDENSSLSAEVLACSDSGFSDFPTSSASTSAEEPNQASSNILKGPNSNQTQDETMENGGEGNGDDDDDNDDVSSTISDLSDLSGISDASDRKWRPQMAGTMAWVQKQINQGVDPRDVLQKLGNLSSHIPVSLDDTTLWKIIVSVLSEPPRREKLSNVNTMNDVVKLLKEAKNIIVLTGAGVSVSCGIPDFRSRDGIYSRLAMDFPDLPDPQAMFDINYFRQDPRPFYKFAREIYPGQFKPSPCHRFIKRLEDSKKLLRNYTQNIDTLEQVAGIENVIECHGSFATASCTRCKSKVTSENIRSDILEQQIPYCAKCCELNRQLQSNGPDSLSDLYSQGIMKPDIVFFGEGLPDAFHEAMAKDKDKCDLLIVVGSSLKVRPVALIPSSIPADVPQILINREPLPHLSFDVELLGDCDVIVNQLCHLMDDEWRSQCWLNPLNEVTELEEKNVMVNQWVTREDFVLPGTSSETKTEESLQPVPKDRHFSTDSMLSAGDSGISGGTSSESPTCSEVSSGRDSRQCSTESMRSVSCDEAPTSPSRHMSVDSMGSPPVPVSSQTDDLEGARWQPKTKESLADRLPDNSYFFQPSSRYIFPGAEVYLDTEYDLYSSTDSSTGSNCVGEEEEEKTEQPIAIIGPLP